MVRTKIGLEIHGYLKMKNKEKLFSDEPILIDAEPNTTISPITTGLPGSKPMAPNHEAVEKTFAIAALLNCHLNNKVRFYRKHYEWPDMPTGYQRTISGTYAKHPGSNGSFLGIGIEEVHLEEDPARWDPTTGTTDYNRSGYPLVEIVTRPDFKDAEEVQVWLKKLMIALSYIDAFDAQLGIKADVNVSVEPKFQRVEIKNVHSFKSIVAVIKNEVERQQQELNKGKTIHQETRTWQEEEGRTVFMRSKEDAMDYCFIPEPDLPALWLTEKEIQTIKKSLPETPEEKEKKYITLGISIEDAKVFSDDFQLGQFFEKVTQEIQPVLAAKWVRKELMRVLHYQKKELEDVIITPEQMIEILSLIQKKKITEKIGQQLLEKIAANDRTFSIKAYIKQEGLEAKQDTTVLQKYCKEVIKENKKAVDDYKNGEEKALHFLVGQVMRKTKGTFSPEEIGPLLKILVE